MSCPERARCSRCCQPPHPTISSDGMHRRLCYGFLVGVHNPHSKPEVQVAHASAVLIDLLLILPYLMYGVGCKATLTFILPYFLVIPIPGSILPHCYLLTKSGEAPPPHLRLHCPTLLHVDFGLWWLCLLEPILWLSIIPHFLYLVWTSVALLEPRAALKCQCYYIRGLLFSPYLLYQPGIHPLVSTKFAQKLYAYSVQSVHRLPQPDMPLKTKALAISLVPWSRCQNPTRPTLASLLPCGEGD